jgi:predicted nucleotidyltransferase component of viral defense system
MYLNEFNSTESLMIFLINTLAESFPSQAILKGGMELRLLNCPRHTNDLDYLFIPYSSKKDFADELLNTLQNHKEFSISSKMHSTCMRIIVDAGTVQVQLEVSAAPKCKTQELSTADLARKYNRQGHIIRAMSLDIALSYKLAAWAERGLMRDLYDIYFISDYLLIKPDKEVLQARLNKLNLRDKGSSQVKTLSFSIFTDMLRETAHQLNVEMIVDELEGFLDKQEFPGLDLKIRKALIQLADWL